ncbi:MAG: monovalent cation/H+ antiporter subunit A [Myxococcota bacterium]
MQLAFALFTPMLLCWLPILSPRRLGRNGSAWMAGAVTLASLGFLLAATGGAFPESPLIVPIPWVPQLGLSLSLRLDGLSLMFCGLVLGIGLLVILYARYYMVHEAQRDRFFAFLLLFMGAMLGLVASENLLGLVVFWELTSVSSFLLVGFNSQRPEARRGARRALGVTGLGGLALLGGVLLLGRVTGSFALSEVLASGPLVQADARYPAVLGLILLGVFTKSAQVPFHFWLPGAMSAPTPASAYLHSATMVKAGVFLLARLWPTLAGTEVWFVVVTGFGLATMLFAAVVALFQDDIKGLLAYSTISHLGLITALFGLNTETGVVAGLFHVLNHATFKASLFMAAGIIDHETGTRDLTRLGGLARTMKSTALLATVASAAMAGIPLLNGFLSKEMFFKEAVDVGTQSAQPWLIPTVATLAGAFSVAYSVRFVWDVFFRHDTGRLERNPHPPPPWMQVPVGLLVALCILVGIAPGLVAEELLVAVSHSVLGARTPDIHLHLWHGLNLPLAMSLLAVGVGVGLFRQRPSLANALGDRRLLPPGAQLYASTMGAIVRLARRITRGLHDHSLGRYLIALVGSAAILGLLPFLGPLQGDDDLVPITTRPRLALVAFSCLLVFGAVGTVLFHRRRLLAMIALGLSGLGSTLIFVELSAPDLALTQLSVEFATTVLILLALAHLPAHGPSISSKARRIRDGLIAGALGLGVTGLMGVVLTRPFDTIADYYLATSREYGGGTNVVNVILVDFRGFDTLGEITVLGIAAIAIAGMLYAIQIPKPATSADGRAWSKDQHPFLLRVMSRPLLPLLLLVAVYLMLRGHNLPGGGFIGGLVASVALILQFMASGLRFASPRLPFNFLATAAVGLAIALATGVVAMVLGVPFLTSAFSHVHLGPFDFELASALAFDLGVFLTVLAVLLITLSRLGHVGETDEESGGP